VRQRGTSHAVFTNDLGAHVTVPMHKPVKPIYVKQLLDLIEG
jgi:predicted RNA binding protein YcfA (HicA-like mRNA interferase family)